MNMCLGYLYWRRYNNSKTVYPIDIANDGSSFKVAGSGEVTWLAVFMNLNAL